MALVSKAAIAKTMATLSAQHSEAAISSQGAFLEAKPMILAPKMKQINRNKVVLQSSIVY